LLSLAEAPQHCWGTILADRRTESLGHGDLRFSAHSASRHSQLETSLDHT
jgi:hypothetical protein